LPTSAAAAAAAAAYRCNLATDRTATASGAPSETRWKEESGCGGGNGQQVGGSDFAA